MQSYLYSKIFDSFENKEMFAEIETTGENELIKRWKKDESLAIKTNPAKTEYPADYTFDIAVIDNENLIRKASAYWHQKLKIAIELKFHRCAFHRIPVEIKKFKSDIEKLKRYQIEHKSENFRGLSIIFIQNDNEKREKEFKNNIFQENYKIAD